VILARVSGSVVSSVRADGIKGARYLLVEPCTPSGSGLSGGIVTLDPIGVSADEMVLVSQGSSTRQTEGTRDKPVDALIIGVVDMVQENKRLVFQK